MSNINLIKQGLYVLISLLIWVCGILLGMMFFLSTAGLYFKDSHTVYLVLLLVFWVGVVPWWLWFASRRVIKMGQMLILWTMAIPLLQLGLEHFFAGTSINTSPVLVMMSAVWVAQVSSFAFRELYPRLTLGMRIVGGVITIILYVLTLVMMITLFYSWWLAVLVSIIFIVLMGILPNVKK